MRYWSERSGIYSCKFIHWLGIRSSKFYDWKRRYGKVNEHNAWIPRDFWLIDWEKQAIVNFFLSHPDEGYRRLAFMMIDASIVAVSPSSVYRVLSTGGYLRKWNPGSSKKGDGFKGPKRPHEHWHIDISKRRSSPRETVSFMRPGSCAKSDARNKSNLSKSS